jgi:hypothetical protein
MAKKRKKIPVGTLQLVLHEAGHRCAVPARRWPLTLDVHHMVYVSKGGGDTPENLLPLCRNCHGMHHRGEIPTESIRAWKMLLLGLNAAFDRRSVDLLLGLHTTGDLCLSGDGVIEFMPLIASQLVGARQLGAPGNPAFHYRVSLSQKGRLFVEGWKRGDQEAAICGPAPQESPP